mgnify:CR=1 FL=1
MKDYLKFSPLLFIYIIICLLKQQDILIGDEDDYLLYADNLLKGFYADNSHEYSFLWNGPGYPILLSAFRLFELPIVFAKLFNTVLIYFGIIVINATLKQLIGNRKAFFISLAIGLYYPFLSRSIPYLLTEALSFFLISLFTYSVFSFLIKKSKKHLWISSITLGYLVLTKIIFAYVIYGSLLIVIPFMIYKKTKEDAKKFSFILLFGFCFTIPYLIYTYNLTDKVLYYGNSGGMSLYWMSTPYENESGDWHSFVTLHEKPEIYKNHKNYINSIKYLEPVKKDIELKNKAFENILNYKGKFFKNWLANIGRLFFGYPHDIQTINYKFYIYLIPNIVIFLVLIISLYIFIVRFKTLNSSLYLLFIFLLVYFVGLSFLSSYLRFSHITLPIIAVCSTHAFQKFISNS